ncbi:MAG TPA: DUF2239 domain-containing protein [Verrucomicrobia bacterium]|nr:DUF2239 domain-containing protein [Verrucomicrobiota bacterium]
MEQHEPAQQNYTAFKGDRCIASGTLLEVAEKVKRLLMKNQASDAILIFDNRTGRQVEVDFRGTVEEVLERILKASAAATGALSPTRGPGRPRLGVVSREVTLLPRHWAWLNSQPGGASVALRKLVEEARRANKSLDEVRAAQDAAFRFMSAIAGNRPGFEEAIRALFAADAERFNEMLTAWPEDIQNHTRKLAAAAFSKND